MRRIVNGKWMEPLGIVGEEILGGKIDDINSSRKINRKIGVGDV